MLNSIQILCRRPVRNGMYEKKLRINMFWLKLDLMNLIQVFFFLFSLFALFVAHMTSCRMSSKSPIKYFIFFHSPGIWRNNFCPMCVCVYSGVSIVFIVSTFKLVFRNLQNNRYCRLPFLPPSTIQKFYLSYIVHALCVCWMKLYVGS